VACPAHLIKPRSNAARRVLTPRPQQLAWGSQVMVGLAWAAFALLQIMRYSGRQRLTAAAIGLVGLVAGVGLMVVARARARVSLVDGQVLHRTLLRERVVWTVGDPGRVVLVDFDAGGVSHRTSECWLLVESTGRAVMFLNRKAWLPEDLEALRLDLGLPLETIEERLSKREFAWEFPGALPGWLAKLPS